MAGPVQTLLGKKQRPKEKDDLQAEVLERFLDSYRDRPPLTLSLLGAMVAIHLFATLWDLLHAKKIVWYMVLLGQHTNATLVAFGARSAGRVAQGEFWRLVTSGFVHGDLIHLCVNGLALVGLGRMAEAVFGPSRYLWIFLCSVVGGALMAQMWGGILSFGASGGLFGVMGALIGLGWSRQERLPPKLMAVFGIQLVVWTLLNLVIGFLLPFVSTSSHVGGLLVGILMGLFSADRITVSDPPSDIPLQLGSGAVLALCFGCLILW